MLKLKLYAMKDTVSGAFKSITQFNNDAEAIRALKNVGLTINDLTICHKDNDMYYIGEYEIETGKITPCEPEFIIHMTECIHPNILKRIEQAELDQKNDFIKKEVE